MPTSLAEQQSILRRALAILDDRTKPANRINNTLRDQLQLAITDHDDPDTGCLADPGIECIAVKRARQILAWKS